MVASAPMTDVDAPLGVSDFCSPPSAVFSGWASVGLDFIRWDVVPTIVD